MNKKIFLVLSVAFLTACYAQAQFTFGVRAGLNITNVSVKDETMNEAFNLKKRHSFQIGIVGEFGDNFAIQPGILFVSHGYKAGPTDFDMSDTRGWEEIVTVNINYLQIPVNAQYKIYFGDIALLFQAGPYFGFAVGGKKTTEYRLNGNPAVKEKTGLAFGSKEDQLNPIDLGLSLGIAVQLNAIQIGLGYKIGLLDMNNNDEVSKYNFGTSMYNRGLSITATYYFGK